MRTAVFSITLILAGTLLGSCATMSEAECLAGDWTGRGFSDGAAGYSQSRLGEHAQACTKHGIVPDDAAYRAGWAQGVVRYCTLSNGFAQGRTGSSYAGVCPRELEADFLPAYEDGRLVHAAEAAIASARSSVDSRSDRLKELDDKIEAKQGELRAEGLTDEQRDAIRNRIREIRREREDTERDWRRAQDEVDDAERNARDLRYRLQRIYGAW
ncbi:DUF2799 domain-containing protein [Brevundimonas sp. GCM10030266]|uniref:DUF2799 domain-containing protein n=1 Tax=Brevundimonas sp. GCM10030266 TaxID=3273386 RepID=UPI00360C10E1